MMGPNTPNDPQDQRNLIIFIVSALLLFLAYEHFLMGPQREAMRLAQQARTAAVEGEAITSPAISEDTQPILPRAFALAETPRILLENNSLKGSVSLIGGVIDDVSLKNYYVTLKKNDPVTLLSPAATEHPRSISHGWAATDRNITLPGPHTVWRVEGNETLTPESPLTLIWENGQGLTFTKTFILDEKYMLDIVQTVRNAGQSAVNLSAYGLISQRGLPDKMQGSWLQHEGPIAYAEQTLMETGYDDLKKSGQIDVTAQNGWIGVTEKYWLNALIPPQGEPSKFRMTYTPAKSQDGQGRYQTDFTTAPVMIAPGGQYEFTSRSFIGAKEVLVLEHYGETYGIPRFDLAVNFGWFWFFSKPFFYALHYLGVYTGNFGIAIILLTLMIRTAVFPLTNASYRSFAKMKKVSPQITEIRGRAGQDRTALQKELVELYQKEGVNPMAGCVPILLQIPIFFALYKVLYVTIEMRHAPFFGWIEDLSARDPSNLFTLFGLIPWEPWGFLHIGVWPCLMIVMMMVQKNLNPPPQDPIQRDMMRYFPFFMGVIMANFAAGLVIYWTFSALITITQQIIIMSRMGVPIHLFGQSEEDKKLEEAVDKGPPAHPLSEMAEDEVEDALFGDDSEEPQKPISPPRRKRKKKK